MIVLSDFFFLLLAHLKILKPNAMIKKLLLIIFFAITFIQYAKYFHRIFANRHFTISLFIAYNDKPNPHFS